MKNLKRILSALITLKRMASVFPIKARPAAGRRAATG